MFHTGRRFANSSERLSQADVHAREAAADRRGDRPLERDLVAARSIRAAPPAASNRLRLECGRRRRPGGLSHSTVERPRLRGCVTTAVRSPPGRSRRPGISVMRGEASADDAASSSALPSRAAPGPPAMLNIISRVESRCSASKRTRRASPAGSREGSPPASVCTASICARAPTHARIQRDAQHHDRNDGAHADDGRGRGPSTRIAPSVTSSTAPAP